MALKKNEIQALTIEKLGQHGEGISHIEGQVVFVAGALPQEQVEVRLLKVGRSAIWGTTHNLLTQSPHRLPADCPLYPTCGGCQMRHMSYELELETKKQRIKDALQRIGGIELEISQIWGAIETNRYRNKIQFPVSQGKKGVAIGFYRGKSHEVVDAPDCLLQPHSAARLRQTVLDWMTNYQIPPYHEATHRGLIRHVYIRQAQNKSLCCIVATKASLPHCDPLIASLQANVPDLVGVVLSVNPNKTNVILGETFLPLWGQDYIDDVLCGLTFRISVPSFYQVNHAQTEVLYAKVLELAGLTGEELVLDLYCGIGTISLLLAQHAKHVIGVEIIPQSVANATQNATRNGITNAVFHCADASAIAQRLAKEHLRPDVITVDPPRKGLALTVIQHIVDMNPNRIIYVSCDPATLARDLKEFEALGYGATWGMGVDMFPRTGHVETVVLMTRIHCLST